ncbi:hypothetical protein [Luteimonas sp. FCS-9]|uniref:hypothetical protein n=1 Tax=Luteimonas sp. FCS-9 TaxID=1547516 RepID=UPI0012E010F9|nr:hypothetical protein [Luteimonas sp. FCS-9]
MRTFSALRAIGTTTMVLSTALFGCSASLADEALSSAADAHDPSPQFEKATRGFPTCALADLFIDEHSQTTTSPYLRTIEAHRCETSDTLVTYCIDERFHGLAVRRLAVPRTTFPVFALYFSDDLEHSRSTLLARLGTDFRASPRSRAGAAPELVQDPDDASASILICTKPD